MVEQNQLDKTFWFSLPEFYAHICLNDNIVNAESHAPSKLNPHIISPNTQINDGKWTVTLNVISLRWALACRVKTADAASKSILSSAAMF